jgi:hypothetical protein
MIRRAAACCALLATVAVACTTTQDSSPGQPVAPVTVTLLTHDSFDVSKSVLQAFEARTGIIVKIVPVGDAGDLANRLILDSGNPEGDLAFGVDNSQIADVLGKDVFVPYASAALAEVAKTYLLDAEDRITPIDHGEVCVDTDVSAYGSGDPAPTCWTTSPIRGTATSSSSRTRRLSIRDWRSCWPRSPRTTASSRVRAAATARTRSSCPTRRTRRRRSTSRTRP